MGKVTSHGPNAWVADMDGDDKPDVLTCVEWSVYPFYTHAAIMVAERPRFEVTYTSLYRGRPGAQGVWLVPGP